MDWYNVPTYLPNLVNALERLIEKNLLGVYHVCGSSFVNRCEWALVTAKIFGLNKNMIKPVNSDILNLPAKRVNVNLCNQKLFKKTGIKMMGIEKGLKLMKENGFEKNYLIKS